MKTFKSLMLNELGKDVRYKAGTELTVNQGGEDIRVTVIQHEKGADKVTVKDSNGKELVVNVSSIKESEEDEETDLDHLFEANVLSKKHFIVIAGMLKNAKTLDQLKDMLFSWVQSSNANFDVERFKKAAGMTESFKLDEGVTSQELDLINTDADTVSIKVTDFDGNSTKNLGLNDSDSVSSFKKFIGKRMKSIKKK